MIDLHSHLLAGIDDGARTLDDSIALAKNSVAAGVTHVMCTPHIQLGVYDNNSETIKVAFDTALAAIREASIPLKLAMGSEVRIAPEILTWIAQKDLPFIGQWEGKNALLLELPHSHIPAGVENIIKWLLSKNVQPVIPHPERNRDILSHYSKAKWLKQLGCLFQGTAGSYTGRFSDNVKDTVWALQKDGLINYIASDMHSVKNRPNDMLDAYNAINDSLGAQVANAVCNDVPQAMTVGINWQ